VCSSDLVDTWEVPGIDGYGAQLLGSGDSEFDLVAISYHTTHDLADTQVNAAALLQGTLVTIIDDWGKTFTNVLIAKADTSQAKRPCIKDGNANSVRVEVHFHCMTAA
jgi:hypothetical protein